MQQNDIRPLLTHPSILGLQEELNMTSKMIYISNFSHSCDNTHHKQFKAEFLLTHSLGGTDHHGKEGMVAEEQQLVTLCLQPGLSDSECCCPHSGWVLKHPHGSVSPRWF